LGFLQSKETNIQTVQKMPIQTMEILLF